MSSLKRGSDTPPTTTLHNNNNNEKQQQSKKRRSLPTTTACDNDNTTNTTSTITCKRIIGRVNKARKNSNNNNNNSNNMDDSNILEELLFPYKVEDFLNDSFRNHAVHVQYHHHQQQEQQQQSSTATNVISKIKNHNNNNTKKNTMRFPNIPIIQNIIDNPDIASLLQETSSESVFVWLHKQQQSDSSTIATSPSNDTFIPSTQQQNQQQEQLHQNNNKNHCSRSLIQSIEISDPEAAMKLHDIGGHALYFRASPYIEEILVSAILNATGLGCGQYDVPNNTVITKVHTMGRGEVEIFIGGKSKQSNNNNNNNNNTECNNNLITGWHYDFQENFTIQISGKKRWTLHPGIVKHPLRGCTPHYDIVSSKSTMESQVLSSRLTNTTIQSPTSMIEPENDTTSFDSSNQKLEVVDMNPGDVLYFPAGMWHTVETVEPGISMNISLMASNYATIVCQALQHYLLQHDEWRQCIQHRRCTLSRNGNGDIPTSTAIDQLQQLLLSLPNLLQNAYETKALNAHSILPPVLLEQQNRNAKQNDSDDSDDEEGDTNDDEEDDCIDVRHFGDGMEQQEWPSIGSYDLYKNPLGILLDEEKEILNCFQSFAPCKSDQYYFPKTIQSDENTSNDRIYVLNVNFAGNESHESAVRKLLRMNETIVQEIQDYVITKKKERIHDTTIIEAWFHNDLARQHIDCLVYYGYLIWVKIP